MSVSAREYVHFTSDVAEVFFDWQNMLTEKKRSTLHSSDAPLSQPALAYTSVNRQQALQALPVEASMHTNPVCETDAESSATSAALARLSNEAANSTPTHVAASIHALIDQPTRFATDALASASMPCQAQPAADLQHIPCSAPM